MDVIVVGAGHAGIEAAHATSKMGFKTLLITSNMENIANMPCNPSIGGTAKGIVVREIDALGGIMGKVADKSHFQIKMLNRGKGPAVRSLRAQVDKEKYPKEMLEELSRTPNLILEEGMVDSLIVEENTVKGVKLIDGSEYTSKIVILTTGTYMKSHILIGDLIKKESSDGKTPSVGLPNNLKELGFDMIRLKTGTPQRIKKDSIDFSQMKEELGDKEPLTFSFDDKIYYDILNQEKCHIIYTNEKIHDIINNNIEKSAMYSGNVTGVGARYCPSIEDKVVRFSDKNRHQLFLEPEVKGKESIYLQGFSTSLPKDVQDKIVRMLPGLENAEILKYAYAIEYDAISPLNLNFSLETKLIKNLFTAGQINGTSGYEEAAAQGLIAGINSALKLKKKEPLILKRSDAYIGVLIDDLITKGVTEPYRLLTSRAEYRLVLRHDNADIRLTQLGYNLGLQTEERLNKMKNKKANIAKIIDELKNKSVNNNNIPNILNGKIDNDLSRGYSLYELLKRPEIKINDFVKSNLLHNYDIHSLSGAEFEVKYEGYIKKTNKDIEKQNSLEDKIIPDNFDYKSVINIATEAKEKLAKTQPKTIGQASRISGVNPSDISVLLVYLKKEYTNE